MYWYTTPITYVAICWAVTTSKRQAEREETKQATAGTELIRHRIDRMAQSLHVLEHNRVRIITVKYFLENAND